MARRRIRHGRAGCLDADNIPQAEASVYYDDERLDDFTEGTLHWVVSIVDRFADTVERVERYAKLAESLEEHGGRLPAPVRMPGMAGDREFVTVSDLNRAMRRDLEHYRAQIVLIREALRIWIEQAPDARSQLEAARQRFRRMKEAIDSRQLD